MKLKSLSMFVLTVILLICTSCAVSKTPVTCEVFKEKMENQGYEIYEITDQYEEGLFDSAQIALKDDYKVEFYVLPTNDDAVYMYNVNKSDFEALKGSKSSNSYVEVGNYGFYELTTNDGYYALSRVENTLIFIKTDRENKDEMKSVLKNLGY